MVNAISHYSDGASWPRAFLRRLVVLSALWWALTEGRVGAVWYFGPVVLAAVILAQQLAPPSQGWSISLTGVARFVPYFLWNSICGGWDVAWRALKPGLPIQPGLHRYTLQLPANTARVLMAYVVSLLPGTLSAELQDRELIIHALFGEADEVQRSLRELEEVVARLFRAPGGRA